MSIEVVRELMDALLDAQAGLEWYQDSFPQATDGSDDEAALKIQSALEAGYNLIASMSVIPSRSTIASLQRERDGYREQAEDLQHRLKFAAADLDMIRSHQENNVWYWQGDGYDHLESMGNDMVVVLHAAVLRSLVKPASVPLTKEQKREWIGLITEEIYECEQQSGLPLHDITNGDLQAFAYAIESKLREKNT